MRNDKSKGRNLLIIIGVVILASVLGFFTGKYIYDYSNPTKNTIDNSNNTNEYEKITKEELIDIIQNELYILDSKTNILQVTNQEKLSISYQYANKEKKAYPNDPNGLEYDTITTTEMNYAYQKTSLGYLGELTNESFDYGKLNGEYSEYLDMFQLYYLGVAAKGYNGPIKIFSKEVDFNNTDSKYTIKYKYAWKYQSDPMGELAEIYGKYIDASNKVNAITDINSDNIENKYEEIKDKLSTYVYTFEKVNGHINLVDFSIE